MGRHQKTYGVWSEELYPLHLSQAAKPSVPEELPVENGQSRILGEMREVPLVCSQGEDRQVLLKEGETIKSRRRGDWSFASGKRGETIGRLTYAQRGGYGKQKTLRQRKM